MFNFWKKSGIPTDNESLKQRGAWLAMVFFKLSKTDLELLIKTIEKNLVLIPRNIQLKARIELTMFSLSKSMEAFDPLLKDKFPKYGPEMLEQVKSTLFNGAWDVLKTLFPQEESSIRTARNIYSGNTDKTRTLWSRMHVLCADINIDTAGSDLSLFEKTVLQGAVIAGLLDSLAVSQSQIQSDHNSFFKKD